MSILISDGWKDYELIDCDSGERLERWGEYILIRPDPQVVWKGMKSSPLWKSADGVYLRSNRGGGKWGGGKSGRTVPEEWEVSYRGLRLICRPTGFKHTGIFPEQATNWDWASELIKNAGRPIRVLNLFAYTGAATCACALAGAEVCHVDAAKGMVSQARRNAALCGLENAKIRYIVDDCLKFLEREIRRGSRYDAVIMDPPSYGRGPGGELWKLEDSITELVELAVGVLTDEPLFMLINSYTTGLSSSATGYILLSILKKRFPGIRGKSRCEELGLPVTASGLVLPCGASARWQAE